MSIKISYTLAELENIKGELIRLSEVADSLLYKSCLKARLISKMAEEDVYSGIPEAVDIIRKKLLTIDNMLEDINNISTGYKKVTSGKATNDNVPESGADMPAES